MHYNQCPVFLDGTSRPRSKPGASTDGSIPISTILHSGSNVCNPPILQRSHKRAESLRICSMLLHIYIWWVWCLRCTCSSPSFMKVLKGPTRSVKSLIENSEALNLPHQRKQKPTGTRTGRLGQWWDWQGLRYSASGAKCRVEANGDWFASSTVWI